MKSSMATFRMSVWLADPFSGTFDTTVHRVVSSSRHDYAETLTIDFNNLSQSGRRSGLATLLVRDRPPCDAVFLLSNVVAFETEGEGL